VWRHIAHSLQGSFHTAKGGSCQDSNRVEVLGAESNGTLIACVADGAGSAKHSEEGSKLACDSIVQSAISYLESNDSFDEFDEEVALRWCDESRMAIQRDADGRNCKVRELATTLCVAILSQGRSIFFQIGDGAIVLENNGIYGVVFWPQSGEYANSTNFLTAENYQQHLEFSTAQDCFSGVALLTDGLERLALLFESETPHPPFFDPLFKALRKTDDLESLGLELHRFLQSESVESRSDDDKTLILVAKHSQGVGSND